MLFSVYSDCKKKLKEKAGQSKTPYAMIDLRQKTKTQGGFPRKDFPEKGFSVMSNDITKAKPRQVVKTKPVSRKNLEGRKVYLTRQGERFADVTFPALGNKGGKGNGVMKSIYDVKQVEHIKRSMKRLKRMIRANFGLDIDCEAHLTLTYKGPMKDAEKLQRDMELFIKRLRRGYKEHKLDYIAVMEPHGHGGWHIHLLLRSDKPLWHASGVVGLSYDKVREMWRSANGSGHGAVRHERLPENVDDYGAYFEAYFTNAIPEDVEISGDRAAIKEAASKAEVKGSRIHLYPIGFKFYRASKNITRPKAIKAKFDDVVKEYGNPTYTVAYTISPEREDPSEQDSEMFIQCMSFKKINNPQNLKPAPKPPPQCCV